MPDTLSVVLRALSFVLLMETCGIALFMTVFGRRVRESCERLRRLGMICALLAVIFVAGHYVLEAARMAGDISGVWDVGLQRMVLESVRGAVLALRVLGLVLLVLGFVTNLPAATGPGGALLVLLSFTLTGHTSVAPHRFILAPVLVVHLVIIAFWFGSLASLFVAARREAAATTAALVAAFSALATWLVPGILLAGLVLTWLLVPDWSTFGQPYGQMLIAKLLGFTLLMGAASLNRWRYGPGIARGEAQALPAFRRSVAAEYLLICGVLAVTAIMTTFYSPQA